MKEILGFIVGIIIAVYGIIAIQYMNGSW
jgi:hypothetical protein